jgi:hypothetical protein
MPGNYNAHFNVKLHVQLLNFETIFDTLIFI